MYHLKYYIIFMIGIFLALGLGIIIGVTLESKDILDNQQALLVKQIEERFASLKDDTEKLKKNISDLGAEKNEFKSISELLFTETISNKLAGLNIAVVSFNKEDDLTHLKEFINTTGASVNTHIRICCDDENILDPTSLTAFSMGEDKFGTIMVQELIDSIKNGESSALIEELQDTEFIKTSVDITKPSDVIILLPGNELTQIHERYDILLIQNAINQQVPIVAVEEQDIEKTYIPDYMEYGISTVDHIDTLYGKLSLLSLLLGNQGNYGFNKNAQGPVPNPLIVEYTSNEE